MCLSNGTVFNLSSLPNKLNRIISCASCKAETSKLNSRHGAVLAQGNRIIACAPNESRTKWGNYYNCCMHAEVNVLKQYCSITLKKSFNQYFVLPGKKTYGET